MAKKATRIIVIILLLSICLSIAAFAAMNSSAYISYTSAIVSKSGNTINVVFGITGRNIMDKIGVTTIDLYEKNGNTWSLVKTFDYTDPLYAADMMAYNTSIKYDSVSYSGNGSKDYFATVYFYAERNGGYDTYSQNTP
jgi:hypothetical protein